MKNPSYAELSDTCTEMQCGKPPLAVVWWRATNVMCMCDVMIWLRRTCICQSNMKF